MVHYKYFQTCRIKYIIFTITLTTLLYAEKGQAIKKQIAIVNSEHYQLQKLGDDDHYADSVEVILSACNKHPALYSCKVAHLEDTIINWNSFDLVLMGATFIGVEKFYHYLLPWLAAREKEGVRVVNGPNSVRLIMNKAVYQKKLLGTGVNVIPTIYISHGATKNSYHFGCNKSDDIFDFASTNIVELAPEQVDLAAIFSQTAIDSIIIKSASTALGNDNFIVRRDQTGMAYRQSQKKLMEITENTDVLIQKYMPRINEGEISFVYINGQIYAYKKTPAEGEYKVHRCYGGIINLYEPSKEETDQVLVVIEALSKIAGEKIYKARIDMVRELFTDKLYLMEAELINPSLLLTYLHGESRAVEMMEKFLKSLFE